MRVLELGNYIVPAYAGMLLSEQGHRVEKWVNGNDPILSLDRGNELWDWINCGKMVIRHDVTKQHLIDELTRFDVVIDNFRSCTLDRLGIEPAQLARGLGLPWVSVRDDLDDRSFDVIAQARSWMEYGPWMPFYLGDTTTGLFLAFKALASLGKWNHHILYQSSCLQKLVEGELIIDVERDGKHIPWDRDLYTGLVDGADVVYKGDRYHEPVRDRAWKLDHLHHVKGRIII